MCHVGLCPGFASSRAKSKRPFSPPCWPLSSRSCIATRRRTISSSLVRLLKGRALETEDLIGVFINLLPMRAKLQPVSSFRQLLRETRDLTIDGLKHQSVPFQHIVQDALADRDVGVNPLLQAFFVFENFPFESRTASDVVFQPEHVVTAATLVDLSLELRESQHEISGFLIFRRDLWEAATIERMAAHFLTLLEGIVADPDRKIGELPLLSERGATGCSLSGTIRWPTTHVIDAFTNCSRPKSNARRMRWRCSRTISS